MSDAMQSDSDIDISGLTDAFEPAWNNYVSSHPYATIYHTLQWRDILYSEYHFEPLYLLAREGDKVVGTLPMFLINNLRGKRLVSLPFSIYGGPLFDNKEVLYRFLNYVKDKLAIEEFKSLRVRSSEKIKEVNLDSQYVASVLDLSAGVDAIWEGLRYKARTAVRRAKKNCLVFELSSDEAALKDFYSLQLMSRKRQGLPTPSIRYYRSMIASFKEKAWLALVRKDGKPLAGGLFFIYRDLVLFAQGASDRRYQTYRPNDLLVWEIIKRADGEGFNRFDFGLTPSSDKELLKFKRKWGAVSTCWYDYIYPEGEKLERADISYSVGSTVFKRLPLMVSARVGRHVIKNLG